MLSRAVSVRVLGLTLFLVATFSIMSITQISSTLYVANIRIGNHSPFDIVVDGAYGNVYASGGRHIAKLTALNTPLSIPAQASSSVDVSMELDAPVDQLGITQQDVLRIEYSVIIRLFGIPLTLSGTEYVRAYEVLNELP